MPSASAPGAQDTPAALQRLRPDDGGAGSQIHLPVVRARAIEAPRDGASTASDRVSSASRAASRSDRSSVDDIAPTADAVRVAANAATRPAEGAGVGQRRSEPRADRVLRLSTAQPVSGVPAAPLHPSIVAAAGAARDGAPETRLEITIGRIDVRAPEPRSMEGQRARRRRDETGLSLSDYLRGTRRPRGGT
jgi:hypothetical protein